MLNKLYFALIHPYLIYGIVSWGYAGKPTLQKTVTLQKRAIRMINKKSYNSHTDPLFLSSNIIKIQDLYNYQATIFMFDYTRKQLPSSFDSVFPYNAKFKIYDTLDNRNYCTYHAASQILLVNFSFPCTCYHQFGTNRQAIYLKTQPVINLESMSNQH